ncbi:hypothetical protein BC943DRAFT_323659 [Umbelopsis sp. AD052]|nr:hypothetical protein BC943DRAFT_323659 [Umbelopsis sp. AD052]
MGSSPLTVNTEDIQFDFQLSDDEIEKSEHDIDPPPSAMSDNDMVYFAIHRPLRISASNPQYIQNLELDTVCYAIDDSTEGDASTSRAASNKVTMQFTGAELPDMMIRYPNAIFYILQHPTWAEPEQLQDLFNQYPDSVVYHVPRPSYLPRVEPDVKHP